VRTVGAMQIAADDRPATFWDLVVDDFATADADLRAVVIALTADREAYRNLAHAAIAELAAVTRDRNRLRRRYHDVLDAHRRDRSARSAPPAAPIREDSVCCG
jgi:hypothetical protein